MTQYDAGMENIPKTIDAVYVGGVLKPLAEVDLKENECVRLTATPLPLPPHVVKWMLETAAFRKECFEKYGYFPDSAETVAADRRRDG